MAVSIQTLKDFRRQDIIYPQTVAKAVYFTDGSTMQDKITTVISSGNNGLPTSDAVYQALNSLDLEIPEEAFIDTKNTAGSTQLDGAVLYLIGATSQANSSQTYSNNAVYITETNVLMGAAWNDYAEYRKSNEIEPGRVVCENGDGTLSRSKERLQPAAEVISDTFGFAIGKTEECQTPVAVSGRVLVFPYEDISAFKVGDAVCAAPNGTVSKMTREEIKEYPERIIGTVSEFPTYDYWGSSNVCVNKRFWIKLK